MFRLHRLSVSLATLTVGILFLFTNRASAQTDEPARVLHLSNSGFEQARSLTFSSTGDFLAVGATSGIYLYHSQELSEIEFLQTGTWARSIAFLPGTRRIAAGLLDNTIKFWEVPNNQFIRELNGHQGWVRSISLSNDGSLIASASDDNTIRVWRVSDGSSVLVLNSNTIGVRAVALSPDGKLVAGALGDHTVRVWSVPDGELIYTLRGHKDWVRCLAFSPDGKLLASGSFDKSVQLWRMANGELQKTLEGHTSSVLGVAFSPDGAILASASVDETVRLWNVVDGNPIRVLRGHTDFVYAVAYSPDGNILASGGGDNTVRLWNLEALSKTAADTESLGKPTPSDCRACHHPRGQVEAARVIELSCENCHAGGIGLSWCKGFARSSNFQSTPIQFNAVDDLSGVPVNSRNLAVVIASPGNGETLYVRGDSMAPEFISGKVYAADEELLSKVEVHLDIISDGQAPTSLVMRPKENGDFNFKVAINPDSPPPFLAKPATRQCLICHGEFVPDAGLPKGEVQIVITAVAPDGSKATDDRWINVDPSQQASVPVQVLEESSKKQLFNLRIEASTILYEWRDRFGDTTSDVDGKATLTLEALTQAQTKYTVLIPPQVLNGILYASKGPIELTLDPHSTSQPTLTLNAHALNGQIIGQLNGKDLSPALPETRIWAIQLPAGPVYQTSLKSQNAFEFKNIPVSQYLVVPEGFALAQQSLQVFSQHVDLFESPVTNMSFSLSKGRPIYGTVHAKDGNFLPFAWANVGDSGPIQAIDPSSGEFLIPDFPSEVSFVTVSSPGYYSLPQGVSASTEKLDFPLSARPETRFIPWGDGQVVLPPETRCRVSGLELNIESGWVWGKSSKSAQPLEIVLSGVDIVIPDGQFAVADPADGMGWLYLYQGKAKAYFSGDQTPVEVGSGQMIALINGGKPLLMEPTVAMALQPVLKETLISEVIEPSLGARIQNWLVKSGIAAMQTITFITYIISLVTLITAPILVLFWKKKKQRNIPDLQENH